MLKKANEMANALSIVGKTGMKALLAAIGHLESANFWSSMLLSRVLRITDSTWDR